MRVSRRSFGPIGAAAGIATLVLSVQSVQAGIPALELAITYNGGPPIILTPSGTQQGSFYNYSGTYLDPLGQYKVTFNLNADPDPLLSGNLVVENMTNNTNQYGLMVTLPTTQALGPQLMGGSAAIGLTDTFQRATWMRQQIRNVLGCNYFTEFDVD